MSVSALGRGTELAKRAGYVTASLAMDDLLASTGAHATRDIAAAAVRPLLDRCWTGVGSVAVLGPEDLSFNDMARVMSEAEVLDLPAVV